MSSIPEPTGSHIWFPDSSDKAEADASLPAADEMSSGQALAAVALNLAEHTVGVSVPADSSLADLHMAPGGEAPSSSVRLTDGDLAEPRTAGTVGDIAGDVETAVGRVPAAVEGAEAAASTSDEALDGLAGAALAVSSKGAVHQPSGILLTYEMMKQVKLDSL